jgi:hypothetical protein
LPEAFSAFRGGVASFAGAWAMMVIRNMLRKRNEAGRRVFICFLGGVFKGKDQKKAAIRWLLLVCQDGLTFTA